MYNAKLMVNMWINGKYVNDVQWENFVKYEITNEDYVESKNI